VSIVEIVVAVITTGPAYVTVWWTLRKDMRDRAAACPRRTERPLCEECGSGSAQIPPELQKTYWTLAA
jgi:hypothetical protein